MLFKPVYIVPLIILDFLLSVIVMLIDYYKDLTEALRREWYDYKCAFKYLIGKFKKESNHAE